jgi:hypothetical protein
MSHLSFSIDSIGEHVNASTLDLFLSKSDRPPDDAALLKTASQAG